MEGKFCLPLSKPRMDVQMLQILYNVSVYALSRNNKKVPKKGFKIALIKLTKSKAVRQKLSQAFSHCWPSMIRSYLNPNALSSILASSLKSLTSEIRFLLFSRTAPLRTSAEAPENQGGEWF